MPDPPGGPRPPRVAVVGGGVTGLATAWYLRAGAGAGRPDVTLVEATGRLGGKVRTEELSGVPAEAGPDTFLARVPWAVDLCRELGMGDELIAPATGTAFVWHGGRLHRLPAGAVLGVPTSARSLLEARSLLTAAGVARATLDLALPRSRYGDDPSVADVVGGRLGSEVLERLVEPLVGGINAGRADRLSLRSAARPLADAAKSHRSLVLGLRRRAMAVPAGPTPVFLGVRGGMERIVDRLRSSLDDVDVRLGTAVRAIAPRTDGWHLACEPGPDVEVDAAVLTVPAFAAAPVVAPVAPDAAKELEDIRYASVAVATLGYRPEDVPGALAGSGFLVPRSQGGLMTACTWSTSKWPALQESGLVLLRASAGRDGDELALELDDHTLVGRLHDELSTVVGVTGTPTASRVDRWPRSFPQYEPGHESRVNRIEAALVATPGLALAGAAYRGLGIAACVQQAQIVAGRVMDQLAHQPAGSRET